MQSVTVNENTGISRSYKDVGLILASLSLSMLLSSLGTSIANVGLPSLARAFSASFQEVQWVTLAYLLASTSVVVSVGRLGDRIDRRRLLMAGILLFTVASALCGLASTLAQLIAARVAQGLGAAVMMALSTALIGDAVPKEKTGSAMGLLGSMSAIGTALGPSFGGVLLSRFGWPGIFLVNVPLGLLTLCLTYHSLPLTHPEQNTNRVKFDTAGTLLLVVMLTAYALATTMEGASFGALNIVFLLVAICSSGLLVMVESKAESPLFNLATFRDPRLSAGLAMSTIVTAVVMGSLVAGPFYLFGALTLDIASVGLIMSSGPVVSALVGLPAGRFVDMFGAHRISLIGLRAMVAGTAILSLLPRSFGVPGYLAPIAIVTAGYALFQAANNTAVLSDVPREQRGVVSGVLLLSRNLGLIAGVSGLGAVFAHGSAVANIAAAHPEAIARGMHGTFAVAAVLVVIALAVAHSSHARSERSAAATHRQKHGCSHV